MSALEILRNHNIIAEDKFSYETRDINDQFDAVEIWRKGDDRILFREFYFIVDTTNSKVYLADFTTPDEVFIAQIERGTLHPVGNSITA